MAIKYKVLASRLEEMIELYIGRGISRLPTEKELQEKYHVSRQTVRAALGLLEEKGLIERRQGSGSHITGRLSRTGGNQAAVLLSSDQDYIYPQVIEDIRQVLSAAGFSIQVYPTGNRTDTEREILLKLLKAPPRGIIVEGCKSALPNPNLDLYHKLIKKGCKPVFLFNYYPALPGFPCIKGDNITGSTLLVHHLADQGHTAIAGIFKFDDLQGVERFQGFLKGMRERGLAVPDERILWYGTRELDGLTLRRDTGFLRSMILDVLESCTAVVCYNDVLSYFLVNELKDAGYNLPEDMAIAAFDNTYLSRLPALPVTSLSHKPHEMGSKAAEALLNTLKGLPVSSQETPWTLNIKESTLGPEN